MNVARSCIDNKKFAGEINRAHCSLGFALTMSDQHGCILQALMKVFSCALNIHIVREGDEAKTLNNDISKISEFVCRPWSSFSSNIINYLDAGL